MAKNMHENLDPTLAEQLLWKLRTFKDKCYSLPHFYTLCFEYYALLLEAEHEICFNLKLDIGDLQAKKDILIKQINQFQLDDPINRPTECSSKLANVYNTFEDITADLMSKLQNLKILSVKPNHLLAHPYNFQIQPLKYQFFTVV
jgi:hypothetical protein